MASGLSRNLRVAFLAQIVALGVSILISLIVPKVLGTVQFSYWQLLIFYTTYYGVFHWGTTDGVYLAYGGQSRSGVDRMELRAQFEIQTVLVTLASIVLLIVSAFVSDSGRAFVLACFGVYVLIKNIGLFFGFVFQALNETTTFSASVLIERALMLVISAALILMRVSDFRPYAVAFVFSSFVQTAYTLWRGHDLVTAPRMPVPDAIRLTIKNGAEGLALMIANLASTLLMGAARWFIDFKWGLERFGEASFALSMVVFYLGFAGQVAMVLFPALRQRSTEGLADSYRKLRDGLTLMLPIVYLLYIPSAVALVWWLPAYTTSIGYLGLLLPICVFEAKMMMCYATMLKVLARQRTLLMINLAALAFAIAAAALAVFVLESFKLAILSIVCSVALRSIVSEYFTSKAMGVGSGTAWLVDLVFAVVFIGVDEYFPDTVVMAVVTVAYALLIVMNRKRIAGLRRR